MTADADTRRIKDVQCPRCGEPFVLRWEGQEDTGKRERVASPTGIASLSLILPIYRDVPITVESVCGLDFECEGMWISCPHCDYEEEL